MGEQAFAPQGNQPHAVEYRGMQGPESHSRDGGYHNLRRPDGRTLLGTLRVNSTDPGTDRSRMMWLPILRKGRNHALMVEACMAAKTHPYVRLDFPLTPGAVELADLTRYRGLRFEARGEGVFRLLAATYGSRAGDSFASPFSASGEWRKIKIPFTALQRSSAGAAWNPRAVRAFVFEISAPPGAAAWLELDNLALY